MSLKSQISLGGSDNHINPLKVNLSLQLVTEKEFRDNQIMRRIHTVADFKDEGGLKERNVGGFLG